MPSAPKYVVSKVRAPEPGKEAANERESRSMKWENWPSALLLSPFSPWLVGQVLPFCPGRFQAPLTWSLGKCSFCHPLPCCSFCWCSWSSSHDGKPFCAAFGFTGGFKPMVGAGCSRHVGTAVKWLQNQWPHQHLPHFPYLAKATITSHELYSTFPASSHSVHPEPETL